MATALTGRLSGVAGESDRVVGAFSPVSSVHWVVISSQPRAAAEEILRIVRERAIPLKALAERSGLARSLIYRMRGGEGHVTLYILAQLSHGAGVPVRDVLLAVEPMETGGRDGREDRGLGVSE